MLKTQPAQSPGHPAPSELQGMLFTPRGGANPALLSTDKRLGISLDEIKQLCADVRVTRVSVDPKQVPLLARIHAVVSSADKDGSLPFDDTARLIGHWIYSVAHNAGCQINRVYSRDEVTLSGDYREFSRSIDISKVTSAAMPDLLIRLAERIQDPVNPFAVRARAIAASILLTQLCPELQNPGFTTYTLMSATTSELMRRVEPPVKVSALSVNAAEQKEALRKILWIACDGDSKKLAELGLAKTSAA